MSSVSQQLCLQTSEFANRTLMAITTSSGHRVRKREVPVLTTRLDGYTEQLSVWHFADKKGLEAIDRLPVKFPKCLDRIGAISWGSFPVGDRVAAIAAMGIWVGLWPIQLMTYAGGWAFGAAMAKSRP